MNDQMNPLIRLMHIFSLLDSYHNKSGLKLMIYDCETKKISRFGTVTKQSLVW